MKNLKLTKILLTGLAVCSLTIGLFAQITLSGKVQSLQGAAVRGAAITFYDGNGNPQDDCSTNSRGEFTYASKTFKTGQIIVIEVSANGFESFKKEYTLKKGSFGTISLPPLIGVKGIVKSDEGLFLKDVTINFSLATTPDSILENTPTNPAGAYQSDKLFKKGQRIRVTATKPGFAEQVKEVEIKGPDDAVANFVLDRRLFIAGYVRDSVSHKAVQGADVFFFSRNGQVIKSVKTNQSGYYDFDAPFTPGEIIRVRIEKNPEYVPIEKTLTIIKHEIAPPRLDFDIPKWEDRGLKLGFRVYNKNQKPLEGVEISYFDKVEKKSLTPANGEVLLSITQKQGTRMEFKFSKKGYREQLDFHNLGTQIEYQSVYMEKIKSCPCWLYASIGLAAVSGTSYGLYAVSYNDYKPFNNLDRESDYDKATTKLRIGTVAGGLAIGAFTGWLICKNREAKKNEPPKKKRRRTSFVPWSPFDDAQSVQIGLAYKF